MEKAGLGATAVEFDNSFERLSNDIANACDSGTLSCGGMGLAPGVLSISEISRRMFLDAMATGVHKVLEPNIPYTQRGPYSNVIPEDLGLWADLVRGLPDPDFVAVYRPESLYLGNTIVLLERLYKALWIPFVLVGFFGLFIRPKSRGRPFEFLMVGLTGIAAVLLVIAQLGLLEVSSGGYLTMGGTLYLLPVFPLVFLTIFCGFTRLYFVSRSELGRLGS
jgi:hypothetical protein